MVSHISADHLAHSLPNFLLPSVSPNIKSFFIESDLCIICPKYFNFLVVAKVSRECLGIIWLGSNAFVLTVHGIPMFLYMLSFASI